MALGLMVQQVNLHLRTKRFKRMDQEQTESLVISTREIRCESGRSIG